MEKIRLGVNIDHVATLRNARDEGYPRILDILKILKKVMVDSVTVHLREDRRHIKDNDVILIKKKNLLPLNLEMAATKEMKEICLEIMPKSCCIVPERREELTTEGGLDVKNQMNYLSNYLPDLLKKKIKVSLFIDPDLEQIKAAKNLGVDSVELHTGKYSKLYKKKKHKAELEKIIDASLFCSELGLKCHAGHGLDFSNAAKISSIKEVEELNVGHFLISNALFLGLENTIKKFMKIIKHPNHEKIK
tara:strand:- start:172 stop:915 length:744 start_codon:yes stop_codon:yes gene_type:complete